VGKTPLAHLGLRALNRIWDPAELSKPFLEIEQHPRGAGIAVAWLSDGARVEQSPAVERDLGSARRGPAVDSPVLRGDREGYVAVPDEDERGS
jgi:hypothetical protein